MKSHEKIIKGMFIVWTEKKILNAYKNIAELEQHANTYGKFLKNIEDSDIEKAIDEIAAEKLRRVDFMVFPDFVEFARIVKSVSKRRIDRKKTKLVRGKFQSKTNLLLGQKLTKC